MRYQYKDQFDRLWTVEADSDWEARDLIFAQADHGWVLDPVAEPMSHNEPNELEMAIMDRQSLGLCPFGPLTREAAATVEAYDKYHEALEAEHKAWLAAGGKSICPSCGAREVRRRSVCTLGYPGHPGAEFSTLSECGNCDWKEL